MCTILVCSLSAIAQPFRESERMRAAESPGVVVYASGLFAVFDHYHGAYGAEGILSKYLNVLCNFGEHRWAVAKTLMFGTADNLGPKSDGVVPLSHVSLPGTHARGPELGFRPTTSLLKKRV